MSKPTRLPSFKRQFYAQDELAGWLKFYLADLEHEIQGVKEALAELEGAALKKKLDHPPKPAAKKKKEKPEHGRKRGRRRQKTKPVAQGKGKTARKKGGWPKGKPRKKVEIMVEVPADEGRS